MSKPVIITTFAANDLPNVHKEVEKVWKYGEANEKIEAIKLENVTTIDLANTILNCHYKLYFFHFGGHAEQGKIIMDGLIDFSQKQLRGNGLRYKVMTLIDDLTAEDLI